MDANSSFLTNLLVNDVDRSKAQLKYELKQLENNLQRFLITNKKPPHSLEEVHNLCEQIRAHYVSYLSLLGINLSSHFFINLDSGPTFHWSHYYPLVQKLKKQLIHTIALETEKNLLIDITSLYYQIAQSFKKVNSFPIIRDNHQDILYQLFISGDLKLWLLGLIKFFNQYSPEGMETLTFFHQWDLQQQQYTLDFFAAPECIQLINALFYYKLYPEKLYEETLHPQKLISIQGRLELVHHYIEMLQQKLYRTAMQHGLKPEIDFLAHNEELPSGVRLEINAQYKQLIQDAVKLFNGNSSLENQATVPKIQNVFVAYKFWFNPIRLIDTAMHLRHCIEEKKKGNPLNLEQEMVHLYKQLPTTECLDLYGYFSNNDTRYLLYTLQLVRSDPHSLNWLPTLTQRELTAVEEVYYTVQLLMDALRIELKDRMITTEPYQYKLEKNVFEIRKRNRLAVLRVIEIYSVEIESVNATLEQLFQAVEESLKGEGY